MINNRYINLFCKSQEKIWYIYLDKVKMLYDNGIYIVVYEVFSFYMYKLNVKFIRLLVI